MSTRAPRNALHSGHVALLHPAHKRDYQLRRLSFSILAALGSVVSIPCGHAQIIADPTAPGTQRPTVLTAPNGVPLVNIQTPSAAGVSRNTYRQFDVQQQGAILNNSPHQPLARDRLGAGDPQ